MVRGLEVFSIWVNAESGIGDDWGIVPEVLDPEDWLKVLDRLDDALIDRDVLGEEESALEPLDESEKLPPELDRLLGWAVPTPLVEEALNVGTAVAVLLEDVRPEVEPAVELALEEELCR
jgi:hypothetical protein